MDKITQRYFDHLRSQDGDLRYEALIHLLKVTDQPVGWAYEVWDGLVEDLRHEDNHRRAIAAQLLSNLAKSDSQNRMLKDFAVLLAVTRDARFVTARHCLQSLWKVAAASKKQQKMVVDGLAGRFGDCLAEKNRTLIRYDILQALRKLYDEVKDERVRAKALELIGSEEDAKYRKKYASLWKVR